MKGSTRLTLTALVCLFPSVALAGSPEMWIGPPDGEERIYGGTPVEPCAYPSTVNMMGSCTGTLVHEELVIYAAHCGAGYSQVWFGDSINPPKPLGTDGVLSHAPELHGEQPGRRCRLRVLQAGSAGHRRAHHAHLDGL